MIDIFEDYKNYKITIEGKNEDSVNQYIYRIKGFLEYNNIKTKEQLLSMTSQNVKKWLSSLADSNSERSRNTKLTAVKEIYKFLKEELKEQIDEDILRIPFAKVPKREGKFLNNETAMDLLYFTTDSRAKTSMAIIFQTGVRFSELIQITCTDIMKGYADIIGKGNKERRIWFDLWVKEIANQYINGKRLQIIEKTGKKTDILIISNNGNTLDRGNFEKSMKYWAKRFNENPLYEGRIDWYEHFSPHKLRHSFATDQLRKGNDIATVRDEMGHSSIATTNNYTHSDEDRVRKAMLNENNNKQDEVMNIMKKLLENDNLLEKVKDLVNGSDKDYE